MDCYIFVNSAKEEMVPSDVDLVLNGWNGGCDIL